MEELVSEYQQEQGDQSAETVSAPEPSAPPMTSGISVDSVVSPHKAEEAAGEAPDSDLIASRLRQRYESNGATTEAQNAAAEYQRNMEELKILRLMAQGQQPEPEPAEIAPGEQISRLQQGYESLRDELKRRDEERELQSIQDDVVGWVRTNQEHYPILNALGQEGLVFQKIMNEREVTGRVISETQAAKEVEAELRNVIEAGAPSLGFRRSEQQQTRKESISLGAAPMSISEPADESSLNDDDHMDYPVSYTHLRAHET